MKFSILAIIPSIIAAVMAAPAPEPAPANELQTRQTAANLFIPMNIAAGGYYYSYIGCYVDTSSRLFSTTQNLIKVGNVNECVTTCSSRGWNYAAIEYGHECYCGNYFQQYGTVQPSWECNYKCEAGGWSGYACGGFWRAQVYARAEQTKIYGTIV